MDAEARILGAAVELLAAGGYDGLTISAVARTSGVSRPTVYAHFGTRERLVSEALKLVATDIAARVIRRTSSASSGAEYLVESVLAVCREFRRQPALAPLAFPQRGSTIFDDDTLGPDSLAMASEFLRPLLAFHPELADDMEEIAETVVRMFLSLVMFESRLSADDDRLRSYLHRRLIPAIGLPVTHPGT